MDHTSALNTLRAPVSLPDPAAPCDFYNTQVRGVSLAIDPVAHERIAAAEALALIGSAAADAVPELVEMLGQDRIGGTNVDDLLSALSTGNVSTTDGRRMENMARFAEADLACHLAAADALVKVGQPAVPALAEALQSPVTNLRIGAAQTLGRIGPAAAAAVDALRSAAQNDESDLVRKAAGDATLQVGAR